MYPHSFVYTQSHSLPHSQVCLCCARCHNFTLLDPLDRETGLDIFKVDPEYEQHEAEYKVGQAILFKQLLC